MRILLGWFFHCSIFLIFCFQSGISQAGCGKNAIGTARTLTLPTTGGTHYGRSNGGRQLALRNKEIVLTFDDGPLTAKTGTVLRTLRKHCAKATFFPVGKLVKYNPRMIRTIVRQGHSVGSHTYSHHNLSRLPYQRAVYDIYKGFAVTARAAGGRISPFFRFPGLNQTPALKALLRQHNIAIFSIDIDSKDWQGLKGKAMAEAIIKQLSYRRNRGIILFHDINYNTVQSLPVVLETLQKQGYKVVHMRPSQKMNMAQIKRIKAQPALMMSDATASHNHALTRLRPSRRGRVKTTRWRRKKARTTRQRARWALKRRRLTSLRKIQRLRRTARKNRKRKAKRRIRIARINRQRYKRTLRRRLKHHRVKRRSQRRARRSYKRTRRIRVSSAYRSKRRIR